MAFGSRPICVLLGASSLNLSPVIWSLEVEQRRDPIGAINDRIEQRFREHGIAIPFPQQNVHIEELPAPSKEWRPWRHSTRASGAGRDRTGRRFPARSGAAR